MNTKRIALVTGAAQGLGLAVARQLAADGMTVVLADLLADAARQAAAALCAAGSEAHALALDVSSEDSIRAGFDEIERRFGRLDVLVNNAGIAGLQEGRRVPVEQMTLATWERTLRVNATGPLLMCRSAVPLMRRGGWGRIVNMASRAARVRPIGAGMSAYGSSKAVLIGLSQVLAGEVGPHGITVNCVAPSTIETPMTRSAGGAAQPDYFERRAAETVLGRIGEPQDIADAVSFLCSEESGFVTGTVIDVNGGSYMS